MAKVIMFEAKDGSIHKTQKECEAVNLSLRLLPAARTFAHGVRADHVGVTTDENSYVVIQQCDLASFIVANADNLRKLLNDALIVKRPRKTKPVAAEAVAA